VSPDELLAWERRLLAWEAQLGERSVTAANPDGALLPAAPVRSVLLHLIEDRRVGGFDTSELARGLDLDRGLVIDVLAGDRQSLTVPEVKAVCDALHASPLGLWPAEQARTILTSYPPETWPRYIEPLDDLYESPASDFVVRCVDRQAHEALDFAHRSGHLGEDVPIIVTPYRHVRVLAVDGIGRIEAVLDAEGPAAAGVDYFFSFEQLRRPLEVDVRLEGGTLPEVAPPGCDAPPPLVDIADRLREWTPGMTMVRFTDRSTSAEHWLGIDPASGAWHTWDDPAAGYPGLRTDVVDPGEHLDPQALVDDGRPVLSLVDNEPHRLEAVSLDIS
jgi:hypothetical protein